MPYAVPATGKGTVSWTEKVPPVGVNVLVGTHVCECVSVCGGGWRQTIKPRVDNSDGTECSEGTETRSLDGA